MEKQADSTQFLTPSQAAKLLNLPTHKVIRMIHRNELPALKVGNRWRIPRSAVAQIGSTLLLTCVLLIFTSEFSSCFIPQSNPKLFVHTNRLSLSAGAGGLEARTLTKGRSAQDGTSEPPSYTFQSASSCHKGIAACLFRPARSLEASFRTIHNRSTTQ